MARRPTGSSNVSEQPQPPASLLRGRWVGSFSGFIRNEPPHPSSNALPQITSALFNAGAFQQVQGYFPCAAILALKFAGNGKVSGEFAMNSASVVNSERMTGHYELSTDDDLDIDLGTFSLSFTQSNAPTPDPKPVVTQYFRFMMCGRDEMHFLSLRSTRKLSPTAAELPNRVTIAQGELHRVR